MSTKNDIAYYETLSDLYNALGLPVEQEVEFTIHNLLDIHKEVPFKSPVFRTNYYSFIFVKDGKGNYTTDEHRFDYSARTIYFTNPGHLKAFEFYELKDAYIITLSEEFLKTNVHKDIFQEFPFLLAETVPPQILSVEKFQAFEQLYKQILTEYQSDSHYKYRIIGNLFVVLLLKIKEAFWGNYYPLEEGGRSSQIVKKFKQTLEGHYRHLAEDKVQFLYQVQDYAKAQNLNPSYLSNVIKSKTGKSMSTWIAEKTIAQAKAFLKHSPLSIKEIGYRLGYSETAHFSNFFKKQTGISPSLYRKKFAL
ncbi:AraC family transcriptional regulator [Rapidithrix thailandica]|uniref:AraC family transcriptional regulator n=1 Tax=Rapidithrix thailandica TaxID=413964 RepID=A0AAW9SIJ2_9BACT